VEEGLRVECCGTEESGDEVAGDDSATARCREDVLELAVSEALRLLTGIREYGERACEAGEARPLDGDTVELRLSG
jgi:hypothetical protein